MYCQILRIQLQYHFIYIRTHARARTHTKFIIYQNCNKNIFSSFYEIGHVLKLF